jgi:predicted HTH domain antitoxin
MKKEHMIASRLPDELIRDLQFIEEEEQSDRSTVVRKLLRHAIADWKQDFYARQYGEGKLTLARAAEAADVSLWELMDYVRRHKIAAQYDLDDLRQDLQFIHAATE